jgi:tetratricopeptide (TPR) repeat protein
LAGDIDGWLDAQHHFVMFLWRQGRYKTALEQSEISIELSKQANTALFKIRALSQHGSIHFFLGDFVQARQYYEQAIYRFKAAGIEGLSLIAVYTNLGSLSTVEGNYAESRKYLEQALDMYRQIGSFFGEGMIIGYLSILAFHEQRYIVALTLAQKALDAMRELNEVVRQAGALMVLGNVYTRLGQWETGRSHYKQALALSRPVDNQKTEIEALINLSLLSCRLGDFQEALALNKQAIQLTAESGDRNLHAYALTGQGRALEGMGQIEEALDSYLAALALRRQMNQLNLIAELKALIAHLYWNQGDLKQAVAYIEDVLAHLGFPGRPNNEKPIPIPPNSQTRPPSIQQLNGAQEPFRLYLTCHQILEATNDERIDGVRDFAIRQLEEQTQQIDDPHLRQSFLENVPVHRQLLSFSKTPH